MRHAPAQSHQKSRILKKLRPKVLIAKSEHPDPFEDPGHHHKGNSAGFFSPIEP